MELSRRLNTLVSLIPQGSRVADIGCDHGFVSIALVSRGIAPHVIAMDLREGPLSRAREHIREQGLEDRIEVRLSDGFAALAPGEADACIIAGMGGRLMQKILTEGEAVAGKMQTLVLQPQSEIREFRQFLRENGYRILRNEILAEEGKYYFPIVATPGEEPALPPGEQELADLYGRDLLEEDRGLSDYLEYEKKKYRELIAELEKRSNPPMERLEEFHQKLNACELALEQCRR